MKVSFRIAFTSALLLVLLPTVTVLGASAYINGRFTVEDLSEQILEQTAARVEEQTRAILATATVPANLLTQHLRDQQERRGGPIDARDFPRLSPFLYGVMQTYPQLSFLGLGLEARGDYCTAIRIPAGVLIQECVRNRSGRVERRDFQARAGGRRQARYDPDFRYDPRQRPWYRAARRAGGPTWTAVYVFTGDSGPGVPGVSCCVPLYDRRGKLEGVVSADFTLTALSDFLRGVRIGRRGTAFIAETTPGGGHQVIAFQPNERLLKVDGGRRRLATPEELGDPRVVAFLRLLTAAGGRDGPAANRTLRFAPGGVSYSGRFRRLQAPGDPPWLLCLLIPEADLMDRVARQSRATLAYGTAGVVAVVLVGLWLSGRAARWLTHLTGEADRIARLELEPSPAPPTRVVEVDAVAARMEQMKAALRSFRKFVPTEVVRLLVASGRDARLGGERRTLTVYFSDITGFTAIAERMAPEALVGLLGEYLDTLTAAIEEAGGTVDKYLGDGILAFWGAPPWTPDHARAACVAAVRSQERIAALNAAWAARGLPPFVTRIGLNTGELVVGTIGSQARFNYTVLGDTVNLASRLEELNKRCGTRILISQSTYEAARSAVVARSIGPVYVHGRAQPVQVYELLGLQEEPAPSSPSSGTR
jgi:adenylate cyclase